MSVPERATGPAGDQGFALPFDPRAHPIAWELPLRLSAASAWHEHIPFAMFLVDVARPRTLVELGTHVGDSYCAFLQAVDALGLDTRCYAVDTWEGDPHAGFYGPQVLEELLRYHEPRYARFSRLIRSTFDEAAGHFGEGSVDLLHLDGYHVYDSVAHDLATWLPKLGPRGLVLLHDINVRERGFGAWRVWQEIRGRYPHFEFVHGHGLGLLAVGPDQPETIRRLVTAGSAAVTATRRFFVLLGRRVALEAEVTSRRGSAELDDPRARLDAERAATLRWEQRTAEAEARADGLVADVTAHQAEIEALRAELEVLGRERGALRAELEALRRERGALRAELDGPGGARSEAETQGRRVGTLEAALREARHRERGLRRQVAVATGRLAAVTASLAWRLGAPLRILDRLGAWLRPTPPGRALRLLAGAARGQLRPRLGQRRIVALLAPSGLFDPRFYLEANPDVAAAGLDPLDHYLAQGAREGRDPHPLFDTSYYLERYGDVARAGVNPLAHYVHDGAREGRDPHPLFDTSFYLARNPDVAAAGVNPLVHYIRDGAREGRDPHPWFDTSFYLARHPEVGVAGTNPLAHFLSHGAEAGQDPHPDFLVSRYLAAHPELVGSETNPLVHHLATGGGRVEDDSLRNPVTYEAWIRLFEPDATELRAQRLDAEALESRPRVSVVMPVFDPPAGVLRDALASVAAQTYAHWELCIADGASREEIRVLLEAHAAADPRIKVRRLPANRGIAGNSNAALELAEGEFVAFLDHDDTLAPSALFEVVRTLNAHPDTDLVYSDRDLLSEDGRHRFDPFFKPDWSPELLWSTNYLCHLTVLRRALVERVGGFRPELDGAQDWDLYWRVLEHTDRVRHVPRVLYHWRDSPSSAARRAAEAKPWALTAQLDVLRRAMDRRGLRGTVEFEDRGQVRVRWEVDRSRLVSIVIPTRDKADLLRRCVTSILRRTRHERVEILLVENGSREPETFAAYRELERDRRVRVLTYTEPFNFSAVCNVGARAAQGEVLLFLNNDTEVLDGDWLDELLGWVQQPGIGMVGAKLLRPDGRLQHVGVALGLTGFSGHLYQDAPDGTFGLLGSTDWYRNVSAVTGACLLMRRDVFEAVGGFDEAFLLCGSDVALGLAAGRAGYRVVMNPFARLQHLEGGTRGTFVPPEDFEVSYRAYRDLLRDGDPFYNPNLSCWSPVPALRGPNEPRPLAFVEDELERLARARGGKGVRPSVWDEYRREALSVSRGYDFSEQDLAENARMMAADRGPLELRTLTWFVPEFRNIYAGIGIIFRLATYLKRRGGVESRFVVETGQASDDFARTIAREFPALAGAEVRVGVPALDALGASDACVATLWSTAYYVLKVRQTRRKFYLMQDYEPAFYPAGSEGALAENTYRFGFYGIATARGLRELYERQYGGIAEHLNICVDGTLFHPPAEGAADGGPPWRVVFYGRPEHPRNGFELGVVALTELKRRLGDRVEIVSIGDTWEPGRYGLDGVVRNLGFVSVQATADLYRRAHAGLVLMFSRHPAVIPLELMASGCPVVMNLNDATTWLYRDGANCRLAAPTAGCLADGLEAVLTDRGLRATVIDGGLSTVRDAFSDWDRELEKVYQFMLDPRARG